MIFNFFLNIIRFRDEKVEKDNKEKRFLLEQEEFYRKLIEVQRKDSLSHITAGVLHDLNNVISIIMGYVELAKMQLNKEPHKLNSTVEVIGKASVRASQLLGQILGYTKYRRPFKKTLNVNEVVEEIVSLIEKVFEKIIIIEKRLDPSLQLVKIDPQELFQVLLNLCLNARDAMPEGGKLTIKTENFSCPADSQLLSGKLRSGDYVTISVSDTGMGIDENTKVQIFQPFFTTKSSGSGLGLSVVWNVIKNNGGYIDVESSPDKGTKFTIFLPATIEKFLIREERESEEKKVKGSEKIMVVDDEEDIRNVAKEILEYYGYEVLLAKDGKEALEKYKDCKNEIDLVLLDLSLPYLKGEDVMKKLVDIKPNVRVLVASGSPDEERAKMLIKLGAKAFIRKPFSFEKLLKLIREILDQPQY